MISSFFNSGDGNQSVKSPHGFNITPEDVALVTKGLGVLAQFVKERTSEKSAEGEKAAKEARNAPAGQNGGSAEQGGGDFLSGFINVVKDLGNTNKDGTAQPDLHMSQEDIARITAGLDSLASTLYEKVCGNSVNGESVSKSNSQGEKVQVSSVLEKTATATAGHPLSSDNTTQHDGFQLTQEDIAKIASGVGSFVDMFKKKSVEKEDQQKQVIKVNSHTGPKPLSLMEKADAQAEEALNEESPEGHDFLNGLLDVAKDVGKVIEQHQNGTDTSSCEPTSNTTAKRGSQQLSQEDIAALTTGIGSLVGALLGQAADHFQKKAPAEEVKKTADEPMVDDVE